MKRKGNIYSNIIDKENIKQAILKASNKKRNRKNVKKVLDNIDYYVNYLHNILKNRTFKVSPYQEMKIKDGMKKKERIIYKPRFFPDQCVHWAIMLQLEQIFKRGIYYYCCASIKGRGILHGAKYLKNILKKDKKNTKYCLQLDVKKFYPSINKEILKSKFTKIIKDKEVLNLLNIIVDSSSKGIPIGNYTSQWFANFYLQDLDHYIKENLGIKYYIRYMDDMLLFGSNKKKLHKTRKEIERFLNKEDLKLKENWQLFKVDSRPIDFLGYRFYRGYTTLRRGIFLKIKRKVKKIYKKGLATQRDKGAMLSYNGWLKHCNSVNYKNKYIEPFININNYRRKEENK